MSEVVTQLQAKLYLDRYPHLYDEILIKAIEADNQFLVLEIAIRYGIRDTSGLEKAPKSMDALTTYLMDYYNIPVHTDANMNGKIKAIEIAFGLKRKIPCKRNTTHGDQVYVDITTINRDVIRVICSYLGQGDMLNLKLTCWKVCEFLLSIYNPGVVTTYKLLRFAYNNKNSDEKLNATPYLLSRLATVVTTDRLAWSILSSINVNVSHLLVVAQLDISAKDMVGIMQYINACEAELILSIVPIPRSVFNAALIAALIFITPYYENLKGLLSEMLNAKLLHAHLFAAIYKLPYNNRITVNRIAHAWKSNKFIADVNNFKDCYSCPCTCGSYRYNCTCCKICHRQSV